MSAPNYEIRRASVGDRDALLALWSAAELVVPWNDLETDINFCLFSGHGSIFVAAKTPLPGQHAQEQPPLLLGSVMVGHDGHRGWLYYVGCQPDYRGRGIAKELIAAAEDWAFQRGVPKLELLVRDSNQTAVGFYQHLGYQPEPVSVMAKRPTADMPSFGTPIEVDVVFLEMAERPTRPQVQPPAGLRLSLTRVEPMTVAFFRYLYDAVGRDWYWFERKLETDQDLHAIITNPACEFYLLQVGGVPAGFCEILREIEPGVNELSFFGLIGDFIGRGLGWYFLNAAVDICWQDGPQRIVVNTCDLDHPRALGNYQRAGFNVVDQQRKSLPDPRLTGADRPPPPAQRRRHPVTALAGHQAADNVTSLSSNNVTSLLPAKQPEGDS